MICDSTLLKHLASLPWSSLTKAQEDSLLAKLDLHNVYLRFQSDMFLNPLAESCMYVLGLLRSQLIFV